MLVLVSVTGHGQGHSYLFSPNIQSCSSKSCLVLPLGQSLKETKYIICKKIVLLKNSMVLLFSNFSFLKKRFHKI